MRCMRRATGRAASKHDVPGLRQWRHLQKSVKMRFNKVLTTRRANPKHINLYRPSKLQCFGKINRFLDETT